MNIFKKRTDRSPSASLSPDNNNDLIIYPIQILRFIASTSVVYLHAAYTSTNVYFGNFGVDIFFLISGFIMLMIIETRKDGPVKFFLDRLTRIIPLYWTITLLLYAIFVAKPGIFNNLTANPLSLAASLLFIPHKVGDYISPLLSVGWTLNYEISFYIILSISLAVVQVKNVFITSSILLCLLFICTGLFVSNSTIKEFYSSTIFIEFIFGMIAWKSYKKKYLLPVDYAIPIAITSFVLMIILEMKFRQLIHENGRIIWGILSFLLVMSSLGIFSKIKKGAVLKLMTHLGDASYATYLSHIFITTLIARFFLRTEMPQPLIFLLIMISIITSLALGSFIHLYVEKPLLNLARSIRKEYRLVK